MTFETWCKIRGFSEQEISIYEKRSSYFDISRKTFMENYDASHEELMNLGFFKNEARMILILDQCNVTLKDEFEKRLEIIKILGSFNANKKNLYVISTYLKYDSNNIKNKVDLLKSKSFSYTLGDIQKLLNNDLKFLTYSSQNIENHLNFFKDLNVSKDKIKQLFLTHSKEIMSFSIEELDKNILRLCSYGYSKEQAYGMAKLNPKIVLAKDELIKYAFQLWKSYGLSDEEIRKKFKDRSLLLMPKIKIYQDMISDLKEKGFTDYDIKKLTLNADEITVSRSNKIDRFYEIFYQMNLNDDDIKKIIMGNPKILYHILKKINDIYDLLKSFRLTDEEIKFIFLKYPRIIESSCESLKEKLKLLKRLDILKLTLLNPKNLIQGCEKTYLRYLYIFNELKEEITLENYNLIYRSNCTCIPDMEDLRKIYSYKDDMENTLEKRIQKAKAVGKKIKCVA